MLSANAARIGHARSEVERSCGVLAVVFKVVVVVYGCLFLGVALMETFVLAGEANSATDAALSMLLVFPSVLNSGILLLVLCIIRKIFSSISKGISPFTTAQAKRIKWVGWLFIAGFILDLIVSAVAFPGVQYGQFTASLSTDASPVSIKINVSMLVAAFCAFCLARVFQYGELLQRLSDDTV